MNRSPEEWERYLGRQIKGERLRKDMTQAELASRAGISVASINRLESGKGSALSTFIKAIKVLGKDHLLEQFEPEVAFSPIQQMELGKQRERARRKPKSGSDRSKRG